MKKFLPTPSATALVAGLFAAQPAAAGTIVMTFDDPSPLHGGGRRHSGKYWLLWLAFATVLSFPQLGRATPVTIVSLSTSILQAPPTARTLFLATNVPL
jgi:hypothetical protein